MIRKMLRYAVGFMLIREMFFAPVAIALAMERLPRPDWVETLRLFVPPFAVLALVPTAVIMAVLIR